ncbi:MAG: hypothetical protein Kow0089_04370 [Desulfobulbaceae bacterium]
MIDLRKGLFWTASIVGGIIGLAGVGFVIVYVLEAIIKRIGEPDQSLLFWYLPVLFTGLVGMVLGFGAAITGISNLRRINREQRGAAPPSSGPASPRPE